MNKWLPWLTNNLSLFPFNFTFVESLYVVNVFYLYENFTSLIILQKLFKFTIYIPVTKFKGLLSLLVMLYLWIN